jgi:hypothetical protein
MMRWTVHQILPQSRYDHSSHTTAQGNDPSRQRKAPKKDRPNTPAYTGNLGAFSAAQVGGLSTWHNNLNMQSCGLLPLPCLRMITLLRPVPEAL